MGADTLQEVSRDVLLEKYAKGDERSIDDVRRRVARALAAAEREPAHWESVFFDAQRRGFIPAGRICSAAGADIKATLINCFVQPVGDSISEAVDGKPGIYTALREAAETLRRGGGVGYDFSAIRPAGALVRSTASHASGPVSYMRVFDRSCETVESAGARRGAQMGVLRIDHPDVEAFIAAKNEKGELTNFNISVAVTDAFLHALEAGADLELTHRAEPGAEQIRAGARRRDDGVWVYRRVHARALWERIMRSTYDHAEPGILFIDRINADNNLAYCERIEATNPCAEQPLPPYGCCCLGSLDLTRFVNHPFTGESDFDFAALAETAGVAVRMLDNVLDITWWPLPQQKEEAMAKRRIGLGFTGLGDALIMLGLHYGTDAARSMAAQVAERLRDAAYAASVELATEKGAFPLFDAERYLQSGFIKRLPQHLRELIRTRGIRNSHLLSIAPTGTISLAFADNASNGIEPAYAWHYLRRKRLVGGGQREYRVEDHAWRLYRQLGGDTEQLPPAFVTALDIPALTHQAMVAAVAPYIDSAISKTVNVAADYPYRDFKDLYLEAWRCGLKGLATFRPNPVTGAVLSTEPAADNGTDPDRRLRLNAIPEPALTALRWPDRPNLPAGNPSWTYFIEHPHGYRFALSIGHVEQPAPCPFEVWINGAEQPRGLAALAKILSMDMRALDRAWLAHKLESLMRAAGDDAFDLPMPPHGEPVRMPSIVAAVARLVRLRCDELGAFEQVEETPLMDALFSLKEPKTGPDGTLSWTVDVLNPATGDDFVLGLKELILPDGRRRPYSVWLSGEYPHTLDGLCKLLSLDMRVLDPAWIGAKLRKLLSFPEPRGDFLARVPGQERQTNYPSTVAYLARLIIHRYAQLGILAETGHPAGPEAQGDDATPAGPTRRCPECGNRALIRRDGCDFCTACGALGACG